MPEAEFNGHLIHWDEFGRGEPMVALHGAADSARRFARQFPVLGQSFRVIAPDLRGMGRSARVSTVLPSDWVEDLAGLLEHLGVAATHVYGVSLGARVAIRFALDRPKMVRSLVLDVPIIANEEAGDQRLTRGFNVAALSEQRKADLESYHGADWETVFSTYGEIRKLPDFQSQLNLREPSKTLTIPTFILRGDDENAAHPLRH
ncbi:MAG: alpha/beta hydrolase, partial [Chloroflexi bacterium]|nr:alpha/beta hydrolase [Chloroflexota bacterium]